MHKLFLAIVSVTFVLYVKQYDCACEATPGLCFYFQDYQLNNGQTNFVLLTCALYQGLRTQDYFDCCTVCNSYNPPCMAFAFERNTKNCLLYRLNRPSEGELTNALSFNVSSSTVYGALMKVLV
jgi:hypothetical protein